MKILTELPSETVDFFILSSILLKLRYWGFLKATMLR